MNRILELKNISKRFPGVQALNNVNFAVLPGEIHALVGENGAGKSTLIKIISGVHRQDSGDILLDDKAIQFNSPREAQARGIAAIYQELSLFPELTVAENIFMGHAPYRLLGGRSLKLGRWEVGKSARRAVDWNAMYQRSREILASLNIHDMDVRRKVGTMSVGNRQRVEIAKALSLNARVLIMDEPTAALTEADVVRLFEIVRLLKERGVSIIYISHRLNEVFELADRVTVLRDGQYIGTKPTRETNEDELINMMVGRTIDNLFPKLPSEVRHTVLEVHNLVRPPFTRDVSFEVKAGEIVGLAGLIGSGRSELAQVIFGILPAQSGQIAIEGQAVRITRSRQAVDLGIAYVPEDRGTQGLVRQMRVRENMSLAVLRALSQAGFINQGAERRMAREAIQTLNVRTPSIEQVVNKLSGGNQQKVVVSKWLASKPKLLIMDEPTRGIDVGAKAEIHRLMSQLAAEGMAVLMISSELPEILGMSDRVLVMREGRIVAEFSRAEATQENIAAAMMRSDGISAGGNGAAVTAPPTAGTPAES